MENVEKLRVLIQHWIDHNKGHAEEFAKWQSTMKDEGKEVIATNIADAIHGMEKVNDHLNKALLEAGGPKKSGDDHEHGHHHHGDGHHHHHS